MFRRAASLILRVSSLTAIFISLSFSAPINVLWFTADTTDGGAFASYQDGVRDLASNASQTSDPWNVTFWDSSFDPAITSPSNFQVLVVASPQFIDGADYSALNANLPTFGSNLLITGMDADWHYMNTPGSANFDGPDGFLLNAVKWAAHGTGLGAVFLAPQSNVAWNFTGLGQDNVYDGLDSVQIAPGAETQPLNAGLTSDGLSNWSTSAKEVWTGVDSSQWNIVHTSGDYPGSAITIASQTLGGLPSDTPEPATSLLAAGTLGALLLLSRKQGAVRSV